MSTQATSSGNHNNLTFTTHSRPSHASVVVGNGNGTSSLFASVSIVCDRKRIVSSHCTCSKQAISWCSHIVSASLFRILDCENVEYRAPVSESLSKLERDQLQKFAQYLISELPQQVFNVFFNQLESNVSSYLNNIFNDSYPLIF